MGIWFHAPRRWNCWFYLLFSLFQWPQCCFLEKLCFKHFSDFSSVWELHWLHSGWLTGVASSTHCDTREDYTHCTTALALACGGKKIGWRAIPQMFTSPTCPQAFRLVTYLSFLFFLFQIQIQIHTYIQVQLQIHTRKHSWNIGILTICTANFAAPFIFTFMKCKQYVDDMDQPLMMSPVLKAAMCKLVRYKPITWNATTHQ